MHEDLFISRVTVKVSDANQKIIGTGILINQGDLNEFIYFVTAAHCLYEDGDKFTCLREKIIVEIYNPNIDSYESIVLFPKENLISKSIEKDLAVIVFEKSRLSIEIPNTQILKSRNSNNDFIIKGFPNATKGQEIDTIYPKWKQDLTESKRFNLTFQEDYNKFNVEGFSGSGVFLKVQDEYYLLGVFTRYRPEDRGKAIYCQYIAALDEILHSNYLPTLTYSYLGENGINHHFFKSNIEKSIVNLGERYSEELNFKLPIAQRFNELANDSVFKQKLLKIFDKWLSDSDIVRSQNLPEIQTIENELQQVRKKIIDWEKQNPKIGEQKIEIDWFFKDLEVLEYNIDNLEKELYKRGWEEEKDNKDRNKRNPYETELSRLRKISRKNYQIKSDFGSNINLNIVNNPFLIVKGIAGSGKSHLFGDISENRLKKDLPTIFLLGQTFNCSITIEENILNQLELSCKFSEFLITLNNLGKQIGSRVLIMVDAINETTNGESMWRSQILGLINQISKFPYVGFVISIRDTYWDYILPSEISKYANIIEHEGFKGNEYEALKNFCGFYNLEQPNFPLMSPEFSNPLFLKLCCTGIANSGQKVFPSGFNGINKIFENYVNSIYSKISSKPEYKLRKKIVWDAIDFFSKECLKNDDRNLKLDKAVDLFGEKFPKTENLLADLIEEGLFIKSLTSYYKDEKGNYVREKVEIMYFAYERLGDYLIANYELDSFNNEEELKLAFLPEGRLGKYIADYYNSDRGILEAFSVVLPERFSLELYEVYSWQFEKYFSLDDSKNDYDNHEIYQIKQQCEYINNLFLNSLKWRSIESISNDKITNYFQSKEFQFTADYDYFLNIIFELSCVENHPMNSDRLFRVLSGSKMAERDSFLQKFILNYSGNSDDGNALSVKRLIEFAWQPNISNKINDETCRLAGQTLAWILSTTNTILRDKVTKALVNLLEHKPLILIEILKRFNKIDDLYILERLYAVAYGVTLRTNLDDNIATLAQYTYDAIFKKQKPPTHILLRDYARNIIEYAIYKDLKIKIIPERIRPPYKSDIPKLPSAEDVKKYDIDHESEKFKNDIENSRLFLQPYISTLGWGDFGRKIVDSKIDDFYPISFTQEPIFKDFIKKMSPVQKSWCKLYVKSLEIIHKIQENDYYIKKRDGEDFYNRQIKNLNDAKKEIVKKILMFFPKSEVYFVENSILPYLKTKEKIKSKWSYTQSLNSEPFKRWIVERVHKLGYNVKIHGEYERFYTKYSDSRYSYHIERISKKYQWIALYEILSIIADNYKMRTGLSRTESYEYYKGAWQNYMRDIDPAYILPNKINENNTEEEDFEILEEKNWYDDIDYKYWDEIPSNWIASTEDLPSVQDVIVKKDNNGNDWLYLQKFVEWKEPKGFGEDKYHRKRKEIWYLIQGYLCNKSDKNKIINYLKQQNFWGRWMPENENSFSTLINREKFWSPADKDETKRYEVKEWKKIRDTNYRVIVASTGAKGSMEEDKSDANEIYNIPCKTVFEGMDLKYSSKDGDFTDETGEIIVTNSSSQGVLIRKDKLLRFLQEKNLEIFWTVMAEKDSKIDDKSFGNHMFGEFSGVFKFENLDFIGSLELKDKRKTF